MKKFIVSVCRIGYGYRDIEVEAQSQGEAEVKARERASGIYFDTKDAEYRVEYCQLVEEGENPPEAIVAPATLDAPTLSTRHVYHYFAEKKEGGRATRADGIAYCIDMVLTGEQYHAFKKLVTGEEKTDGWTVISMTYFGVQRIDLSTVRTSQPVWE